MFEQIPPTIFVAAGTIAAALISGTIAFLNLIISKEQAVSEFRQRWIDALREEIADFLSAANSISVHSQVAFAKRESKEVPLEEALEPLHDPLGRLYATYHRIMLRLNPEEHKELSVRINVLENAMSNPKVLVEPTTLGYMLADVNTEAQSMLKMEWTRVKRGEATYRVVKLVSAVLFGLAVLGTGFIIVEYIAGAA